MPLLTVKEAEELIPALKGRDRLTEFLIKALNINKVSDLYDEICGNTGADFATAFLKEEKISYRLKGEENLDKIPDGPFITISNHPYGALDGIMLIDLIGQRHKGFKVMVNQFLTLVKALRPSLISVNPATDLRKGITATNLQGVREVFRNLHDGLPVGFFPSGAVSDFIPRRHCIEDRPWQTDVIKIIRKAHVPVVPVRFFDRNTAFYYFLGLIDWRIRVLRLPTEVTNKKGKHPRIGIGDIITPEMQDRFTDIGAFGKYLRDSVYSQTF